MELFQVWHEVSNSLTAVNLTLEFLQRSSETISTPELVEELAFSLASLDHIKHVLQSVSASAREATQQLAQQTKLDVVTVIQNVISTVSLQYPNSELLLDKKQANFQLYGDKTALTQVFMNLFINAIQSYENEALGGKSRVKISMRTPKKTVLEIQVKDWGNGIPKSAQPHIFEPGFSLKQSKGGTGTGLAIVKDIIEQTFGGQIVFSTIPGKGTTFIVQLPVGSLSKVSR